MDETPDDGSRWFGNGTGSQDRHQDPEETLSPRQRVPRRRQQWRRGGGIAGPSGLHPDRTNSAERCTETAHQGQRPPPNESVPRSLLTQDSGERWTNPEGSNALPEGPGSEETQPPVCLGIEGDPGVGQDSEAMLAAPHTESASMHNKRRATIKVASANMRGLNHTGHERFGKWSTINGLLRDKKIGVLVLQETHLPDTTRDEIETLFRGKMTILSTAHPDNPSREAGVAIVINRRLIRTENVRSNTIVPGRAIEAEVDTLPGETMRILGIYAPNEAGMNREFLQNIRHHYEQREHMRPDLMMGDFNMVEDSVDRVPARRATETLCEAMAELKSTLAMCDGWRRTNPSQKAFTYTRDGTGRKTTSRIDRIYIKNDIFNRAGNWSIAPSGIEGADHMMVSVEWSSPNAPIIGRGRWSLPAFLVGDEVLLRVAKEKGNEALAKIRAIRRGGRTVSHNPQAIYRDWKTAVTKTARERARERVPKLKEKLQITQADLERLLDGSDGAECEDNIEEITSLQSEIMSMEDDLSKRRREAVKTRNLLEGETISKYWSMMNKPNAPRDTIHALKNRYNNDRRNPLEKDSHRMAEIARLYHRDLQTDGVGELPMGDERRTAIADCLRTVRRKTSDEMVVMCARKFDEPQIAAALRRTENGRAAGLDGLSYELYKRLEEMHTLDSQKNQDRQPTQGPRAQTDGNETPDDSNGTRIPRGSESEETPPFNILELLAHTFNDVAEHGPDATLKFNQGWMCPIYKKGEKSEIKNYRPITVLNADYKLMTKVLADRLGTIAPHLLHEDQAGFVPGRRIVDQTKQVELMIDMAEEMNENGLVIALDQEKAYDKVSHDYLWKVLETFGLPAWFIGTIKNLYKSAETKVMINGCLSKPFEVTRGVRQGDPMSCILFDLAIEPLAEMLRQSTIDGFKINGIRDKVITSLFADDTTVYLSESDSLEELQSLLAKWCTASTAKFNIEKTEIIPIGDAAYRRRVIETRVYNEDHAPIPENLHIAADGEATRILGAWVGNKISEPGVWTPTLEKIERNLTQWGKSMPTMEGRRLIVQMVVAGMTQYLAQVQGMPKDIENALKKRIRKFVWAETDKSPVAQAVLEGPIEEGGRAVLDIVSRNEAISLGWLKRYLEPEETRPKWAYIADRLIAKRCPQSETSRMELRQNVFTQNWKTKLRTKKAITEIISIARKHKASPAGTIIANPVKLAMPLWYHFKAHPALKRWTHNKKTECLRRTHQILSVGDAKRLADALGDPEHTRDEPNCLCDTCLREGDQKGCENPHRCMLVARDLLGMINDKWSPDPNTEEADEARNHEEEGRFDPCMTTSDPRTRAIRILAPDGIDEAQAPHRNAITMGLEEEEETILIFSSRNNDENGLGSETTTVWTKFSQTDQDERDSVLICDSDDSYTVCAAAMIRASAARAEKGRTTFLIHHKELQEDLTKRHETLARNGYLLHRKGHILRLLVSELAKHESKTYVVCRKRHLANAPEYPMVRPLQLLPTPTEAETGGNLPASAGAQLMGQTQRILHRIVRKVAGKKVTVRESTRLKLSEAKKASKGLPPNGKPIEEDKTIWKGIRRKEIRKEVREFLWKTLHNVYWIGAKWAHIPDEELQERQKCGKCGETEDMNHILTECRANGQAQVWEVAEAVLRERIVEWEKPRSLGEIIARITCEGMMSDEKGRRRLERIVTSEAAHMIWVTRCKRAIQNEGEEESPEVIRARAKKKLADRLKMDHRMTHSRYGTKALSKEMVRETWRGLIGNEDLTEEAGNDVGSGVLVGRAWRRWTEEEDEDHG